MKSGQCEGFSGRSRTEKDVRFCGERLTVLRFKGSKKTGRRSKTEGEGT